MYASIGIAIQILHWRRRVRAVGGLIGAASARLSGMTNHAKGTEMFTPESARWPGDGRGVGFDARLTSAVFFARVVFAFFDFWWLLGRR